MLVATGIILIILATWFFVRKGTPARKRQSLLEKARAKLTELKKQSDNLTPETIATRISIIVRQYLETAFEDPALFETNEEFTLRPRALEKLHPDTRQPITDHLQRLSELKYEPQDDSDTANASAASLIDEADKLLSLVELHPAPLHPTPTS